MSRASRQRDSVAPSLFPFLAVLLCTMGALVLILMLIVSGAQASARQIAQQSEQQFEETESQLQVAKHSFQKQLVDGQIALEKKRLALQHLENHIQELLNELTQLQRTAELAAMDAESDEASQAAQAEAISQLEKQLLEAGEKLKRKLDKPDGDKPIFAIIPYDGPNGTHRRPIYLECVEEGIRIQPEGILLRINDLEPPYGPGNPLDAALRTIRAQYVPANHAVTSTAYPLLIVRPSGIRTYAMARAAMSGWDDQFGYELIGEDLELTFPEGEPGLSQKIAQALDLARQRQAALIMAMPQKYREFSDRTQPLAGAARGGSTEAAAAEAFASGSEFGSSSEGGGWNGSSDASYGGRGGWADGSGGGGTEAVGSGPFSQSQAAGGAGQSGLLGFGSGPNGQGAADNGRNPTPLNPAANGLATDYGGGAAGDRLFGSQSAAGSSGGSYDPYSSVGSAGPAGNGPAGNELAGNELAGNGQTSSSAGGGSESGNRSGGSSGSGDRTAMSGSQTTGGNFSTAGNSSGAASGSSGGASGQSSGGSSGGSSSGSASGSAGGSTAGSASASNDPSAPPQLSVNQTLNAQREAQNSAPVARRRGRGWAWSQGPSSQTPVGRSIRLQCFEDRWVVLPDSGKASDPSITIAFEGSPQQRAEQLAKLIADRVDGWGMALTGGFWKPVLMVDVAPGADWRFNQLQQLLDGSGLDVQRNSPTK